MSKLKVFVSTLSKNSKSLYLILLLLFSFLIRFVGLGYSDFYGDETKTFYLDKTVPAYEFFMDQRKGPIQFLVVWIVEKFINGHDEFYTRLPFALAGFISVIAFYLLVKDLFTKFPINPKGKNINVSIDSTYIAIISTLIFSLNGFNVAFSRVIQYQSFMLLFGLCGMYFFLNKRYLFSAISLGLALLSHYDAVFLLVPIVYLYLFSKDYFRDNLKNIFVRFLLPLLIIVGSFYIPYIYQGYFGNNAWNYLNRRISGDSSMEENNSLFTINFYNPYYIYLCLLLVPIFVLIGRYIYLYIISFSINKNEAFTGKNLFINTLSSPIILLFIWFIPTFVFYEFLVSNPGTHIHNYFLPLYILSGYSIVYIYSLLRNITSSKKFCHLFQNIYKCLVALIFGGAIYISSILFIPSFNYQYPWNVSAYNDIHNKYQIFIYGFPYNRSWNEVNKYFVDSKVRIEGVFTNDNDTIAEYYLRKYVYTRPGTNFFPQYYIYVKNGQEFLDYKPYVSLTNEEFISNYQEVKRFSNTTIYKRIDGKTLPIIK